MKPVNVAVALLELYQRHLSTLVPSSCRFSPSCSEYAKQAIEKYGITRGALKAAHRLARCHPLSGRSGYDPLE